MDLNQRRNAVKVLALAAPVVWCKPVVDSVVLPAHAQMTSPCSELFSFSIVFTPSTPVSGQPINASYSVTNVSGDSIDVSGFNVGTPATSTSSSGESLSGSYSPGQTKVFVIDGTFSGGECVGGTTSASITLSLASGNPSECEFEQTFNCIDL